MPVKMSQFKLKADLVKFLLGQYNSNSKPVKEEALEAKEVSVDITRRNPRSMPPLRPIETNTSTSTSPKTNDDSPEHKNLSPKDIIFEHVLTRYPPLRGLQAAIELQKEEKDADDLSAHMHPNFYRTFTGLGDMDIRQKYHPIMNNMTSSDLDIVAVGTASCVPGVTRGVSCTALRLQWRRNGGNKRDGRGEGEGPSNAPNTGGIWIFDCGESTQVRCDMMNC